MALDWIPITVGLPRREEVLRIAELTGMDRHKVLGHLVEFWLWCTQELKNGRTNVRTLSQLSCASSSDETFLQAMIDAGWLVQFEGGFEIPRWDV